MVSPLGLGTRRREPGPSALARRTTDPSGLKRYGSVECLRISHLGSPASNGFSPSEASLGVWNREAVAACRTVGETHGNPPPEPPQPRSGDRSIRRVQLARALTRQCDSRENVHKTLVAQSDCQWFPTNIHLGANLGGK